MILGGFIKKANAHIEPVKYAVSSATSAFFLAIAATWLLGGCAPAQPPEPYVAKRGWLGVETRSTGSDYASLGTAQEPVIVAQPVKPLSADEWEIEQPEPMVTSVPLDISDAPVPKTIQPIFKHRRAPRKVKRPLTKAVAPLCRPTNTRSSS